MLRLDQIGEMDEHPESDLLFRGEFGDIAVVEDGVPFPFQERLGLPAVLPLDGEVVRDGHPDVGLHHVHVLLTALLQELVIEGHVLPPPKPAQDDFDVWIGLLRPPVALLHQLDEAVHGRFLPEDAAAADVGLVPEFQKLHSGIAFDEGVDIVAPGIQIVWGVVIILIL